MMKSSLVPPGLTASRNFWHTVLLAGAGVAAFCLLNGISASVAAREPGRVIPLSREAQNALKGADIGFAVSQSVEQKGAAEEARARSQGNGPSLIDSLQGMLKKDTKKGGKETAFTDGSELKMIKRRPLAERLEMTTTPPEPPALPAGEGASENLATLSPDLLRRKGDASFEAGDMEAAERYYLEQIGRSQAFEGIDESLVSAYHHLGVIERQRKNYSSAQNYFVLAIKSDPAKNPQITFDYAKVLYETEKYERAEKLFVYLEGKRPEMTEARYYRGLCLLNTDPENDEILACLEDEIGSERACEMIAEKCEKVGASAKAEEMRERIKSIRESSASRGPGEELAGELAPASLNADDDSVVFLGSNSEAFGENDTLSPDSPVEGSDPLNFSESSEGAELAGLTRDQTTRIGTPLINIETIGPKQTMVGQESEYKISVENKSDQKAGNLLIRTDISEDVDITCVNASTGNSHISSDDEGQLNCLWDLGDFEPNQREVLTFKFTPRVRNKINFVTVYDYDKAVLSSGIEVTQPVIEIAIEGNDAIQWGSEDRYRVKICNNGDGKAQNVRLTVATGDNDNATRILPTLEPGEEKELELNLKTVLDNVLEINAHAEADYGFTASAEKVVDILRGELDLFVEVPGVQFVNENADYVIHVCNTGRAPLRDVDVIATVPTSIEVTETTGDPTRNKVTKQLVWLIPVIKPEEEIVYQVSAKMLRAGGSRLDVTAADRTGVSCFGNAEIQVEAIAALEMKVNKPAGAIATGKEVVYEVVIGNSGTKAAEKVDAGFFLPTGMTPVAVEGGGKVIAEEQKVLFNKINFLGPGQTVVFKVHAVAEERGNHKVQAVLESKSDNVQLVREEMNFFYDRKPGLAQRSGNGTDRTQVAVIEKETENKGKASTPVRLASRQTDEDDPAPTETEPTDENAGLPML